MTSTDPKKSRIEKFESKEEGGGCMDKERGRQTIPSWAISGGWAGQDEGVVHTGPCPSWRQMLVLPLTSQKLDRGAITPPNSVSHL